MVTFKKYDQTSTLEDLGTLQAVVGKGGTAKLNGKNFRSNKRVVVIAKNKAGDSAIISCSAQVSDLARQMHKSGKTKEELIAWFSGLSVLENEEGVPFISMPADGAGTEVSLDKVKAVETKDFIPAELVAF
jgi:hypothetical protein